MATLIILQGPDAGRQFSLERPCSLIGREAGAAIVLASRTVSRQHAQIFNQDNQFFIEDLGSSNGTLLNGRRIKDRAPLQPEDELKIGEYRLALRAEEVPEEAALSVRDQVAADRANPALFAQNPVQKLKAVLELADHLGRTLDMAALLDQLLEHLLRLFPQADRGLVLLWEEDHLTVRAQRSRRAGDTDFPYSRTIVRQALADGTGLLSADVGRDERFTASSTVEDMGARSLLCVPLLGHDGRRLGVLQLDCAQPGQAFVGEDLRLLTTVGLQVAVVLENAALNAERLREAELHRELALARQIQEGFLPSNFAPVAGAYELFARIHPAREVSGDLYDCFAVEDGRLAFFLGDVSGKGMPAALFTIAVHTLSRHVASTGTSPAATLNRLNAGLVLSNPSAMFVTLLHGLFEPRTGEVVLAVGGHPLPLLRRADGRVEELALKTGRLLGFLEGDPGAVDVRLTLAKGETLIAYSDGYTEAFAADSKTMFGVKRLQEALGGERTPLPLAACAEQVRLAVQRFAGSAEPQDDLTLLLLRRL